MWQALLDGGLYVNMARPPATPAGTFLLRCSLCAEHSAEQVDTVLDDVRRGGPGGRRDRLSRRARLSTQSRACARVDRDERNEATHGGRTGPERALADHHAGRDGAAGRGRARRADRSRSAAPTASATARCELQAHSYEVMILARTLSGTIADAEASLGRYVISGDKQLGPALFRSMAARRRRRSTGSTADTATIPSSSAAIDALREAYAARGTELSLTALSTSLQQERSGAGALLSGAQGAIARRRSTRCSNRSSTRERALLDAAHRDAMRVGRRIRTGVADGAGRVRRADRARRDRARLADGPGARRTRGRAAPKPRSNASARRIWRRRSPPRPPNCATQEARAAPGPEDGGGRPADRRHRA